ncbi:MAG: acylphosphatase [Candidatus Methanofastidiosa archaeon]|nr:acylphosphatase [Candidatus Methanofastidiosa archaeon]
MKRWMLVRVEGRVQGVYYRDSARTEARRLGVTGWVRNVQDGSVEARIEGDAGQLDGMLLWLRSGPPAARVDAVVLLAQGEGAVHEAFTIER